jgi:UDP-N-acetylmuramoyl-L-alanyl-D-glutamate--2,6-diaminopimelate ligase
VRLGDLVAALAGTAQMAPSGVRHPDVTALDIAAVVHDTRDVVPGALFCCVRGTRVDGHDLAGKAIDNGAVALIVDHLLDDVDAPQVVVPDVRAAMGPLAAAFWRHPSADLTVIGVTGTAGKTTVTHLLQAILDAAGRPSGLIGTISGTHTTPDATELQAMLAAERDAGRAAVVMEVSSHGLALHRVDGTRFEVAVFTNLSRDHLDFHHTMDEYFAAKARLFDPAFTNRAVICADDPWGRRLLADLAGERTGVVATSYGLGDVTDLDVRADGCSFTWQGTPFEVGLPGRFNALNALAAAVTAQVLGIDTAAIGTGLRRAAPPAGRFEPVDAGQPFTVLVDYAHKPDALEQALTTSRELTPDGRVIVVFGCGGDRDATKRPIMGAVAASLADRVILTSDNPRSEDPLAILDEIRAGVPADAPATVDVEPDRRRAIVAAIDEAQPGDLVLIAGKGHETTQTTGDHVAPFDDRVEAHAALVARGTRGSAH